jgi:hypothetical protein
VFRSARSMVTTRIQSSVFSSGKQNISSIFLHSASVLSCAGILEQSMGARNRLGIGLSYWPARLHRLVELIHWNQFLGSLSLNTVSVVSSAWIGRDRKVSIYIECQSFCAVL